MLQSLLEQQRRSWETRHPRLVEDFLQDYPQIAESDDDLKSLVYQEVILEARFGAMPSVEDYVSRFPCIAGDIRRMFELQNDQPTEHLPTHGETGETTTPPASTSATLGDYEILHEIARGGMGVVYKARQVSADRTVALKMIRSGALARDEDIERFQLEAVAAANLDHPAIVPVFEVGSADGQHYFSMGYVDGPSLAEHLQAGAIDPRSAAALVRTIAGAISYAHTKGVIHRDLKPANVLLDAGGQPRVTDFGLAKRLGEDTGLTVSGQIMGTPSYMAPEQAAGQHTDVGPAADQYSLGAILYHAVTGVPPFQAPTVLQTIDLVTNREPVPPRQRNPGVDRDLDTIILKTLDKNPAARYPSIDAFAGDLTRYLSGLPVQARPVSAIGRVVRWSKRNPVVACLFLVIATGILAVAIGSSAVADAFRESAETEKSLREESTALLTEKLEATTREEQARTAYAEAADKAREADILAGRIQYAADSLKHSEVFENPALARTEVARHLEYWHPGAWAIRGLPGQEPHIFAALDSPPDFRGWEFFMLSAVTNTDTRRTAGFDLTTKFTGASAATSDGRLAFATMTGIHVATALDFRSARFTPVDQTKIYRLDFHPEGDRIASAGKDGTVRIWEVGSEVRAELHRLEHGAPVNYVAYAGAGQTLVSHGKDGVAHVWDLQALSRRTTIENLPQHCALAVSPDGGHLAVGVKENPDTSVVKVFDTGTGEHVQTFARDGHTDSIQWIDYSPDGSRLATCSTDTSVLVWDVASTTVTLRMDQHALRVLRVAWSPDGNKIASAGSDLVVRVWDPDTGEPTRQFTRHRAQIIGLHWSGDGDYLYSAAEDTNLVINDLTAPLPVAKFQVPEAKPGARPVALQWHPTGDRLNATIGTGHLQIQISGHASTPDPHAFHGCWSHDATHRAHVEGSTLVVTTAGGEIRQGEIDPLTLAHLTWSPAPPARLAFLDGRDVKIWDVSQPAPEVFYTTDDIDCLGWKADGLQLAVSSREEEVQILDTANGESLANFHCSPPNKGLSEAYAVGWSADGNHFATAIRINDAVIFDPATWQVSAKLDHGLSVRDLAWSPPGQPLRLATACDDSLVRIWDPQHKLLLMKLSHPYPVQRVAWSPDGKKIASMDNRGLVKIWDASHGYVARGNIDDEIARGRR